MSNFNDTMAYEPVEHCMLISRRTPWIDGKEYEHACTKEGKKEKRDYWRYTHTHTK
jgi:hypothetical protein